MLINISSQPISKKKLIVLLKSVLLLRIYLSKTYSSESDIDILRSFNNTFGKATGPANGYDDSRIMAIGESLGSNAGIDWLSAQEADTSAEDIRDSMTQNALDALNLPENSNYNPNVGAAMSNALRSIANTGKVGF